LVVSRAGLWVVTVEVEGQVSKLWDGQYLQDGNMIEVQGDAWNRQLAAGESTSFGFCADRDL
jgi:cellulase/cellobiase CelA1